MHVERCRVICFRREIEKWMGEIRKARSIDKMNNGYVATLLAHINRFSWCTRFHQLVIPFHVYVFYGLHTLIYFILHCFILLLSNFINNLGIYIINFVLTQNEIEEKKTRRKCFFFIFFFQNRRSRRGIYK